MDALGPQKVLTVKWFVKPRSLICSLMTERRWFWAVGRRKRRVCHRSSRWAVWQIADRLSVKIRRPGNMYEAVFMRLVWESQGNELTCNNYKSGNARRQSSQLAEPWLSLGLKLKGGIGTRELISKKKKKRKKVLAARNEASNPPPQSSHKRKKTPTPLGTKSHQT